MGRATIVDLSPVLVCLLEPAAAGAEAALRAYYAQADPRVRVYVDRRGRPEIGAAPTTSAQRRRFAVPRRLEPLPAELAALTGPVRWIQRIAPVGTGLEGLDVDAIAQRVRHGDNSAAAELYWRAYERLRSRLSVLLGSAAQADAHVGTAYGRLLDLLDDPSLVREPVDALLYAAVDAAAEELAAERDGEAPGPSAGLGVEDPELDEAVRVLDPDPAWITRAREEIDRLSGVVGGHVVAFAHVGSTAVGGVAARGTLDLLGGVRRLPLPPDAMEALELAGYEDCGPAGTPDRVYLRRRGRLRVDLHLVAHDGPLWADGIAFRRLLAGRPAAAERWSAVKRDAARIAPTSAARYYDLRRLVLEELLQASRATAAG